MGLKAAVAALEMAGAEGSVAPVETSGNFCLKSANSPSSGFCALVLERNMFVAV
jgi:hypothetical protein